MANIILAEDDDSLRQFLAAALERAGHAVTAFGDGAQAYHAFATNNSISCFPTS
jgi:two-component system cell cycle response regulator CpdR